jgi:hypothetical protein
MRFTLRDIFAFIFLVALFAWVCRLVANENPVGILLLIPVQIIWALAVIGFLFGARERKVRDDERGENSQN